MPGIPVYIPPATSPLFLPEHPKRSPSLSETSLVLDVRRGKCMVAPERFPLLGGKIVVKNSSCSSSECIPVRPIFSILSVDSDFEARASSCLRLLQPGFAL